MTMPSSNARTATLFVALTATSVAFVTPASALDFNNPKDKRVYCQVYATQALSDVHAIQARGCGFSGISWSGTFDDHFNWCLSQGDMAATVQENVARSSAVQQCNGSGEASFPPVVDETPAQAATNFPPVVADETAAAEDEKPAAQTAALPPVVDAPAPVRTASATPPSVVEADDPGVGTQTPDTDISSRSEEAREGAERLIEFGREHKDEIRHAAHKLKEKIKEKLSEIKNHHHHDDAGQPLRAKVKDALKGAIQRRLASR
jgi:hypothetical protein